MESTELPYNDARFEEIKKEILSYIQKNGYNPAAVAIVPISGWHGDNMLHQDVLVQGMGHRVQEGKADGKYLLETMDGVLTPTRPTDKPLHLPLKDVNKTVRRNATRSPAGGRARTQRITAQVIVLNRSGQISNGYTPVLECHTAHIACEYSEIKQKVFRRSGKSTEDHPKSIKSGDDTIVFLVPPKPLCAVAEKATKQHSILVTTRTVPLSEPEVDPVMSCGYLRRSRSLKLSQRTSAGVTCNWQEINTWPERLRLTATKESKLGQHIDSSISSRP
ncbi:elongation factor 1-alpha [Culex quinquefasciatus]|uniref:Elongation factor 1-alpha n=1 Tax=Culex quinquefasciatus TaxID=7176 RepID=B0WEW1_CULQU|nr:elongation factor 1-alpha [Culex quinquefasciatus]|eukprot:XP_001847245.1 elongation factor 1-alpha [Culex quinquefasciatus]